MRTFEKLPLRNTPKRSEYGLRAPDLHSTPKVRQTRLQLLVMSNKFALTDSYLSNLSR